MEYFLYFEYFTILNILLFTLCYYFNKRENEKEKSKTKKKNKERNTDTTQMEIYKIYNLSTSHSTNTLSQNLFRCHKNSKMSLGVDQNIFHFDK